MWSPKYALLLVIAGLWSLPDAVVENERLFEAMAPDAQREMVRKWERFSTLSEADQERWRAFDAQLAAHPDAEQLRSVMDQYYEWNLALSDRDRATLSSDSVDKRMELVQKIRLQQHERNLGKDESSRLSLEELKILQQWFRESLSSRRRTDPVPTIDEFNARLDVLQSRFTGRAAELMAQRKGKIVDGRDERRALVESWGRALMEPSSAMLKSVYESLTEDERIALSELPEMTPDAIENKLKEYYFDRVDLGWLSRMNRGPGRGPGGPQGGPGAPRVGPPIDRFGPDDRRPGGQPIDPPRDPLRQDETAKNTERADR
ncbi:MAG: hypothetical protein Q8M16_06190 [Pirellulaceae bacterium]|nr:hypothetical protein [Pirellulaceae bacterium]